MSSPFEDQRRSSPGAGFIGDLGKNIGVKSLSLTLLLVFFQEEPHGTSPPPNYIKNKDLTPSPFTTVDLNRGREIAG